MEQEAATLRQQLIGGQVPLKVLTDACDVSFRTGYWWCQAGMPYTKIGKERYVDPERSLRWLAENYYGKPKQRPSATPGPPRPVGRPRKAMRASSERSTA